MRGFYGVLRESVLLTLCSADLWNNILSYFVSETTGRFTTQVGCLMERCAFPIATGGAAYCMERDQPEALVLS